MLDLSNNVLVITGGTGSFGNAVLRRYLSSDIRELRILSRDEKKQYDLRQQYLSERVRFYIGDVRDRQTVDRVLAGADMVFHAAALKQVPSCEFHPMEAIKTNVLGADNVLESAITHGVQRVIVLSTDKAVYPINAMGMTKALMEKVAIAKSRDLNQTIPTICATRYGNVMGSRGSVIPLFVKQALDKEPLTITDGAMTRFLMHLDEAVDLVEFAFEHGDQGDIFVRKSPASTIQELAEAVNSLFRNPGGVRNIGTRHGEKLYETLVNREEMATAIDSGGYFRIPRDPRDLNYEAFFTTGEPEVTTIQEYTSHNTERLGVEQVKEILLKIKGVQIALESRSTKDSDWHA